MTQQDRNMLEEEMKQDALSEYRREEYLKDYDAFLEYYQETLNNCICAIKHLRDLHYQHGHEWDCRELEMMIDE